MDQRDQHEKIVFPLKQDAEGYPPFDSETLWAVKNAEGTYRIDNIPFFVKGISLDDIVSVRHVNGRLVFDDLVVASNNSVFRILILDEDAAKRLQNQLVSVGCQWEESHIPSLFSVHMPPTANWDAIETELLSGIEDGFWEVEEASMRR